MKNLDETNPRYASPRTLCSLSAWLPLVLSACSLALAWGAAPTIPVGRNPIFAACALLAAISALFIVVPFLFKWDWKAEFFGKANLDLASIALLGIVPLFCIIYYGLINIWLKFLIGGVYSGAIYISCRPFIRLYATLNETREMRELLYHEEDDAIYYRTVNDKVLITRGANTSISPPGVYFVGSFFFALFQLWIPRETFFASGIPRIHWFLLVLTLPICMVGFAIGIRGWLTCYWYPLKNRIRCGKLTYVDMVSSSSIDPIALRSLRNLMR